MSKQRDEAAETLEHTLEQIDDPDACYHIRQALQILSLEEIEE